MRIARKLTQEKVLLSDVLLVIEEPNYIHSWIRRYQKPNFNHDMIPGLPVWLLGGGGQVLGFGFWGG